MSNQFEKEIGETFIAYSGAKVANLFFLFPPMRPAGMHGSMPAYVPVGKAPYDAGGYYIDGFATTIGVELKQTAEHENRLPIVAPDKKGNGLHYHQLEALLNVHRAGGVAILLWSNGGEIGRLTGPRLEVVRLQFDTSLKAEGAKKEVAKGSRSILWGDFELVKHGHDNAPLWLPSSPQAAKQAALVPVKK